MDFYGFSASDMEKIRHRTRRYLVYTSLSVAGLFVSLMLGTILFVDIIDGDISGISDILIFTSVIAIVYYVFRIFLWYISAWDRLRMLVREYDELVSKGGRS